MGRTIADAQGLEALSRSYERAEVVVVVGAGIGGLVLASKLAALAAQRPSLRVALVLGRPPVKKRLVAGCSLRRSALDTIAGAFGIDRATLVDRLGARGAFHALASGRVRGDRVEVVHRGEAGELIGLSTRHGHILSSLRTSVPSNVDVIAGEIGTDKLEAVLPITLREGTAALGLPEGRHVVIDTTPQGVLRAAPALEAERWVFACQVPLSGSPKHGSDVGFAPQLLGEGSAHLAFFTPFSDPDTPAADHYGINTLVVGADRISKKDAIARELRARLEASSRALGLTPVDPDETFGAAMMPVVRATIDHVHASADRRRRIVATHPAFSPGAVAINVDGMLAESIGATALALHVGGFDGDLFEIARDGLVRAYRALASVRADNVTLERAYFSLPAGAMRTLQRVVPQIAWRALVRRWADLGAD
jgi:hypothetical protein